MANIIQIRRDTSSNWTSVNPILAEGEVGLETNTNKRKTGDGTTVWASLDYDLQDKQDVLVSGTNIKTLNGESLLGSTNISIPQSATIADTGTEINLGNTGGNLCNMASANATETYTLTGSVDFGSSLILINRATAPTITGATNILGSDFIANTDMYLQVFNNGTRVEYWLEQIAA